MCSGTSNNEHFADFELLIVKNCDYFPQNFQLKNEGPVLPFHSGISYMPIGNTVHQWHNIEHALWILELEVSLFAHFVKIWDHFACLTKKILHKIFSCAMYYIKWSSFAVKMSYATRICC